MNRRGFISFLSALPFIGSVLNRADAALQPVWGSTPEEEFGKGNFRYASGVYAWLGDIVYCERGHAVAVFNRTVKVGDPFDDAALDFLSSQTRPVIGEIEHPCAVCGARWFKGPYLRFGDGWRIGLRPFSENKARLV